MTSLHPIHRTFRTVPSIRRAPSPSSWLVVGALLTGLSDAGAQSFLALPSFNGAVDALAISGNTMYVGGSFTTVDGATTRNRLAAIDLTSGSLTSWDPGVNGAIKALSLSPDGNTLYVGGSFTQIGGGGEGSTSRNYLAALSTATGTVTSWNPDPNGSIKFLSVSAGGATEGNVYAVGGFSTLSAGGTSRGSGMAGIQPDGTITAFNPINNFGNVETGARGLAVSGDGNSVYLVNQTSLTWDAVGGGTVSRRGIAGLEASTGLATTFDPAATEGPFAANSFAVLTVGNALYISGSWDGIGGEERQRIAKFVNEALDTDFDTSPGGGGGLNTGTGRRMAYRDGVIYLLGDFDNYQGSAGRSGLAAINATTGDVVATWNPGAANADNIGHDSTSSGGMAVGASGVYFGDPNMVQLLGQDMTGRNIAGLTAVPEPHEYALVSAALCGGLVFWRRRQAGGTRAARS